MKIYSPPQGEEFAVTLSEQVRPKAVGVPDKPARRPTAGVSLHELICPREGAPEASGCVAGAHVPRTLPGHQIWCQGSGERLWREPHGDTLSCSGAQ